MCCCLGECDYECTGEVETNYDGITVVPFVSINDDLSLEYNDKVKMIFTPYYERYIDELREKGEFVRTSAFVDIRDNDGEYFCGEYSVPQQ